MAKGIRHVGLDVHAETIAVAVADADRKPEFLGNIPNTPESLRRTIKKLGNPKYLRACYEAGPCGYVTYWTLTALGVDCTVVAPTLIPVKVGDRVKTDRRDAEKLARLHRAGELTAVWVPDRQLEAMRDLVRCREAAQKNVLRARHQLGKFLLRLGYRRPPGMKAWSSGHRDWLQAQTFEFGEHTAAFTDYLSAVDQAKERVSRLDGHIDTAVAKAPKALKTIIDGLQALRGVAKISAVTIAVEVGRVSRFEHPRQLMGYAGLVPQESSSGGTTKRGRITKTGNPHLRRIVGEAAWHYRFRPNLGKPLVKRQQGLPSQVTDIAWKAQHRLNRRFNQLTCKNKKSQIVVTAVARELLGFIWAIGKHQEDALNSRRGKTGVA